MDFEKLAELLLPNIDKEPQFYEDMYPQRNLKDGAMVTRFAPSPTGFLHIGAIYASMINYKLAKATGGVFILRIEDTDKVREVENGVGEIVRGLEGFDIIADEGFQPDGSEKGQYGPYQQSHRAEIYQTYAKSLIKRGLAYPCFCTADELSELRREQETEKLRTGYYGKYAKCRNLTLEEIEEKLNAGMPFVVRLRSPGDPDKRITLNDVIRGKIEMPENDQDIVILKSDGIPTYHFAHAIDDHLMHTTHVVRGDEWISSAPTHLQLFYVLGFKAPKYAHIAPIVKNDGGGKRKLSKRKDPEAAVSYYHRAGYPREAVMEYLTTISNSNFEEWRKANKDEPLEKFPFNLKKMSISGALIDLNKMTDVSKTVISKFTTDEVYEKLTKWARQYDGEYYGILTRDPEYTKALFSIDRGGKKPRKDIAKWEDAKGYSEYFYDELFKAPTENIQQLDTADVKEALSEYLKVYDENDEKDAWFEKIRNLCAPLGFSPDVKAYKQNPQAFKGHVGDLSTAIRIAVTGRENTPDLCSIMKLLGRERVIKRINNAIMAY